MGVSANLKILISSEETVKSTLALMKRPNHVHFRGKTNAGNRTTSWGREPELARESAYSAPSLQTLTQRLAVCCVCAARATALSLRQTDCGPRILESAASMTSCGELTHISKHCGPNQTANNTAPGRKESVAQGSLYCCCCCCLGLRRRSP